MPFITIDVIPDPHGSRVHHVVIKRGNEVLSSWPVGSEGQGQKQILDEIAIIDEKFRSDVA